MAYVQPGDISAILNAFGQLGQSNALIRQRKDQAAAERASTQGAIGGLAGGIGAGLISGGNPYAAMAGSAAGSQLLSGGRTSGAQTINQAGQAYQMATSQQDREQAQADRGAITRAGEMLNPAPVASGPMLGDEMQGTPTQTVTQPEPNVRGAIGELFRGGQVGPAISLLAAQQKGNEDYTLGEGQGRYRGGKLIAERDGGGNAYRPATADELRAHSLDPVRFSAQVGPGGKLYNLTDTARGQDSRADMLRYVRDIAVQRKQGAEIKPEDAAQEQLFRQELSRPINTPEGQLPGINFKSFDSEVDALFKKTAGASPLNIPNREIPKTLPPEQQQTLTLAGESRRTIDAAMAKLMPGGKINSIEVAKGYFGIPWTDARMAQSDLVTSMGNIIYLKSGKAINMEEARRMAQSYLPSPLDGPKGQAAALERIKALADDSEWLSQYGLRPEVARKFFARQGQSPEQDKKNEALKNKYGLE